MGRRLLAMTAAACAAAVTALPGAALADDTTTTSAGTGASFAVSTPAEPIKPDADGTVRTVLTVANNAAAPLTVRLRAAGVTPADDGKVRINDQPEPGWQTGKLPDLTLAAHTYRKVPLSIRPPKGALPDLYLLGFLAEAVPTTGGPGTVLVYNQIASLVTVEVPGVRERELAVAMPKESYLHIGNSLDGEFKVDNVGPAAAMARGQLVVNSATGNRNIGVVQASDQLELMPAGTSRTMTYNYEVNGLFLLARPSAVVMYGSGSSAMHSAVFEGHPVLVVPLASIILLAVLLLGAVTGTALLVRHRRKLRRSTPARHSTSRKRPAVA